MIKLIYVSSATEEMAEQDLLSILQTARSRNTQKNVTGMLLYSGGNFIQVLEGEEQDVDELYRDIEKDPRHGGHIVLERAPISERTFPDWSMGFRHLTSKDSAEVEGFTDFLSRQMSPEELAHKKDMIVELLYLFKQNN